MNYTINHYRGCCAEESKGAFWKEPERAESETSWQDPQTGLSPWLRSQRRRVGLEGRQGWAAKADVGTAVMGWDPHLIGSTHVGAATALTWNIEWVLLARVMPLQWPEWRGSCTKILYNGHEAFMRHRLVKPKWRWEVKPSFENLLTSLWWIS